MAYVATYRVTYNANGGSVSPGYNESPTGSIVTLPTPSRTNYTFAGWFKESSLTNLQGGGGATFTPTANITLYAKWVSSAPAEITDTTGTTNADGSRHDGTIQTYTIPTDGYYKLEVWGAAGGIDGIAKSTYGYGGYSVGVVYATSGTKYYIGIGGKGTSCGQNAADGYNGGGYAGRSGCSAGGGGATHIATVSGKLSALSSYIGTYNSSRGTYDSSVILIVAGAGAGIGPGATATTGHGGGYIGNSGTGTAGSQTAGGSGIGNGSFGQGGHYTSADGAGGGGGWFGGGSATSDTSGGGGSGYIGSSKLLSVKGITKHMTCFNCSSSSSPEIRTQTTTNASATATSDYAMTGGGAVKITYLGL